MAEGRQCRNGNIGRVHSGEGFPDFCLASSTRLTADDSSTDPAVPPLLRPPGMRLRSKIYDWIQRMSSTITTPPAANSRAV